MEFGSGGDINAWAGDSDVDVKVGDGALGEPVGMLLDPFDGADQAVLFGIPGCEDTITC